MSFQKVFILGNAGKDAEVRHLDGGNVVASFSIATSETYKDRNGNRAERTEWHNIKCFGKTAEFAEKYVKKGTSLFIEGKMRTSEYTDRSGNRKSSTDIVADSIQFAGGKKDNDTQKNNNDNYGDMPY